jgi:hypothetical protein
MADIGRRAGLGHVFIPAAIGDVLMARTARLLKRVLSAEELFKLAHPNRFRPTAPSVARIAKLFTTCLEKIHVGDCKKTGYHQ